MSYKVIETSSSERGSDPLHKYKVQENSLSTAFLWADAYRSGVKAKFESKAKACRLYNIPIR